MACVALYGATPEEYFQFEFEKLNDEGRREYMCDQQRFKLFRPFYDFDKYELVRNKANQYKLLSDFYGRTCVVCDPKKEKYAEFETLVKNNDVVIFKPLRASCGQGVSLIETKGKDVSKLYDELCSKEGIAEELIVQAEGLAKIHPQSVNTVRCIALCGEEGDIYFTQTLLRIGMSGSLVDNADLSIRARIDEKTGVIYTRGIDIKGNRYIFHPDTGVKIVGYELPDWAQLLDVAKKAMERLRPITRYIGFDLACTEKGWIIVEINPFPQIYSQQISTGHGNRKELERLVELTERKS
jgi:predicted ATP-grasp superfamily ATP-dependent carboligase